MTDKIQKPCYFFNTGGCYHADGTVKTEVECKYLHCKVNEPLEKPQHLKPPCKYYHLRGHCRNPYCVFGHSELSTDRWKKYFPTHQYPGIDYAKSDRFKWDGKQSESKPKQQPQSDTNVTQVKAAILMMMLQMLDEIPD